MSKIRKVTNSMEIRTLPEIKLNSFGSSNRQKFWLALKRVQLDYIEETKVHGFFFLRVDESIGFKRLKNVLVVTVVNNDRKFFLRIFWWTIIILAFSFGGVILHRLITQFFEVPFQITNPSPALLLSIPFPSVSLCHPQTVIKFKASQFVDRM